jgi:uroporphyrinogen-III synthase
MTPDDVQTSDAMPGRPCVALLEARMSNELARLVEKHGGAPLRVPALAESAERADPEAARQLLRELGDGRHEIVIFQTGVAVSLLFELAEQLGQRAELVSALRRVTTICRGPKPSAALRGFGVAPTLSAREPFTVAELIDALSDLEVAGHRVLLFNYGERNETLSATLRARRVELCEFWLYRWQMPDELAPLERLVRRIVYGDIDALIVTCQIQVRHLHQVAQQLELERELVQALNERVVVGAVGPTCMAILEAYGVQPQVVPDHPKMGPLVLALMRQLDLRAQRATTDAPAVRH